MKTILLTTSVLTLFTSLSSSQPTPQCIPPTSEFYLVTTSSPSCSGNSSYLPSVAATSTFAPAHQPTLLLRTIGPGYNSLPNFTLADGTLQTISNGPFGVKTELYKSITPGEGEQLGFVAAEISGGGFSLEVGYLLAVGGDTDGWTLCETSGQAVVS